MPVDLENGFFSSQTEQTGQDDPRFVDESGVRGPDPDGRRGWLKQNLGGDWCTGGRDQAPHECVAKCRCCLKICGDAFFKASFQAYIGNVILL